MKANSANQPITLLLQGGLGNQLLQVVLAHTFAAYQKRPLQVDTTLLKSQSRLQRGLTQRALEEWLASQLPTSPPVWHHWLGARLRRRLFPLDGKILTDPQLLQANSAEELLQPPGPDLVISHGTSPLLFDKPFQKAWAEIHQQLPKMQPLAAVGLHLRRGDYLNPKSGFMPLPLSYYRKALELVFAKQPELPRHVQLFSDEPAWGMEHMSSAHWQLELQEGSPEQDLAAMSRMRALVISNSSLSAIAAHLGESFGSLQIVVCPEQWLGDPNRPVLGDLRKPSWISLSIDTVQGRST